jgi:hypothetical protein
MNESGRTDGTRGWPGQRHVTSTAAGRPSAAAVALTVNTAPAKLGSR